MTTLTIQIPDTEINIIDDINIFLSRFKGVSFDIKPSRQKNIVTKNLKEMCREISSGEALGSAKPLSHLYEQLK